MKLFSQCCTLGQAKRLKELGVRQESYFSWFGDETPRLMDNCADGIEYGPWLFISPTIPINNQQADHREDTCCTIPIASAFTVAEMGAILPSGHCLYNKKGAEYKCYRYGDGRFCAEILSGLEVLCKFVTDTEAQCRAALLIHLLENNIAAPAEVNDRLGKA